MPKPMPSVFGFVSFKFVFAYFAGGYYYATHFLWSVKCTRSSLLENIEIGTLINMINLLGVAALNFLHLLQLLLVVKSIRSRLTLLELHNIISKGGPGLAEELASATLDILAPI